MDVNSRSALLPVAPSSLCFDKNEFMKDDFSVDKFVADCRRRVQLETLRQDLEVYFKLLKNAMIELINKDYADFVNLSANLVGMDKAILQLREPLTKIREDIATVSIMMTSKINVAKLLLVQQDDLSENQDILAHMMGLLRSVEKIEQIQTLEDSNSGQILERIAGEFNELQHHAGFCKGLPVLNQVRPRISEITSNLQHRLEELLLLGVNTSDTALLHRCLNSYALIGKTRDAEKLVQVHLVHPYMNQVLKDQQGDISQKKLTVLFSKIVDVIPSYCKLLCDITAGRLTTKLGDQYRGITGYDFVVRSVWPEIVQLIENNYSAIFSPGDPNLFHVRYNIYMDFITNIERQCGSQASVLRLRQSEEFTRFQSHWSLPVYFQMRFQEIGGKLEDAIQTATNVSQSEKYRLHVSAVLYSCIESCWSDHVYLAPLLHRFWKVTLQCLARYDRWLKALHNSDSEAKEKTSNVKIPPVTMGQIAGLIHDLHQLNTDLPDLFVARIQPRLTQSGFTDAKILKIALENSISSFINLSEQLSKHVISTLTSQGNIHLRYTQDVPRLFRRTNREAPTKPSSYIKNVLKPAVMFRDEHSSYLPADLIDLWLTEFASRISESFFTVVSDVLTSVKKMEESLMRLQKMRAGKSSGNLTAFDDKKMSDDDKIRLQLYLDVVDFSDQLTTISIETDKVSKLKDLLSLVSGAKPADNMEA